MEKELRYSSPEEWPYVLQAEEARHILGIGTNMMYNLIRNGEIQALRVGRKYIVPRDSLVEYINGGTDIHNRSAEI